MDLLNYKTNTMKTKTLFYLTFIFGLIFSISGVWLLIELIFSSVANTDFHYLCVIVFILSTLPSGWFGMELAKRYLYDPEQFIEDIKSIFK